MNARKCIHAQKPYPSQAFAHESSKVGRRGKNERMRDKKDGGQEADGILKRKSNKINNIKNRHIIKLDLIFA